MGQRRAKSHEERLGLLEESLDRQVELVGALTVKLSQAVDKLQPAAFEPKDVIAGAARVVDLQGRLRRMAEDLEAARKLVEEQTAPAAAAEPVDPLSRLKVIGRAG